jgi:hypothetical protein
MLGRVRQWRKKAYEADKVKRRPERAKEAEDLAQKLSLPLIQTHKAGPAHRP